MKKKSKKSFIVYDNENRYLYDKNSKFRAKRKLTRQQGKLLMLFSDGNWHSYEEIDEYIYKERKEIEESDKIRIRTMISKLRKRIVRYKEINILRNNKRTDAELGRYIMKGELWLE